LLAEGDESGAEVVRHPAAEDESACLDARHLRDASAGEGLRQGSDCARKERAIGEQSQDVRVALDPAKAPEELLSKCHHSGLS
jgi:hypothetical protein